MHFADTIEPVETPELKQKGRLARDQLKSKTTHFPLVNPDQKIAPPVAVLFDDAARTHFAFCLSIHSHGRADDGFQGLSNYPAAF